MRPFALPLAAAAVLLTVPTAAVPAAASAAAAGPRSTPATVSTAPTATVNTTRAGKPRWNRTGLPADLGGLNSIDLAGRATVAVGFGVGPTFAFEPLAFAWNGRRWREQPVVLDDRLSDVQLTDLELLSSTSGWAVGHGLVGEVSEAVTARWDGSQWQEVATTGLPSNVALHGVATIAEHDVWAAGQLQAGPGLQSMLAHHDGVGWQNVDVPPLENVGADTALLSISASGPTDVWAVGRGGAALRSVDGTWQQVVVPRVDGLRVDLTKVRVFGPDDVWAVGYVPTPEGELPVALAWDGSAWATIDVPVDTFAQLTDVVRTRTTTVAIGYESAGRPRFFGLKLYRDRPAAALKLPRGKDALFGAAADPDRRRLWVVGSGAVGELGDIRPYAAIRQGT